MNGRFLFDFMDHDHRKNLEHILAEMEIVAEPDLAHPLNELFTKETSSCISKRQAYDSIVFYVRANPNMEPFEVLPVKTALINGVKKYDVRELARKKYNIVSFFKDNVIVLEAKRQDKTYEIALFTTGY